MNSKFILRLLSGATLLGSAFTLFLIVPVSANALTSTGSKLTSRKPEAAIASCDASSSSAIENKSNGGQPAEEAWLDFTAAESDAAAILFGCDCPSCINALRQLRTPSLMASVQGHCWTNLSRQGTEQDVNSVLEAIEQAEQIGPDAPLKLIAD